MPDPLATRDARQRAAVRSGAVARSLALIAEGRSEFQADSLAAEEAGVKRAAVMRWRKRAAREDAAAGLMGRGGAGRPSNAWKTPGAEEAWRIWCADYLREEAPGAAACWRRVRDLARVRGWTIPCERMFRLRLRRDVPPEVIALRRGGVEAVLKLYPDQVRTVAGLAPLDAVSGDGDRHRVFVLTPDGRRIRPVAWYWQDVRTRKILGWHIGETESQDVVRLAFVRMLDDFGAPRVVVIDNTHAASSKWWSANTRRGWRSDAERVPGVMEELGIRVVHTHVEREVSGRGLGWGQAKPVERIFLDVSEGIDRHPLCAGAYAGPHPTAKPANYETATVPWDVFLAVVADGVREYNARPEREMEVANGGRSIDDVWTAEVASTPVRRLTPEQRALLLLACESTQVNADGTFKLAAGRGTGLPANIYHHDSLRALVARRADRRRVVARLDPDNLHQGVWVYDLEMRFLCFAECQVKAGFLDTEAARRHNRARNEFLRATKRAAAAYGR